MVFRNLSIYEFSLESHDQLEGFVVESSTLNYLCTIGDTEPRFLWTGWMNESHRSPVPLRSGTPVRATNEGGCTSDYLLPGVFGAGLRGRLFGRLLGVCEGVDYFLSLLALLTFEHV